MEERFIFHLANSVAKMQRILGNRVITNKEVLCLLDSILEYCRTDKIKEKVDVTSNTCTERREFMHGSENKL